jgi:hypothetical protein
LSSSSHTISLVRFRKESSTHHYLSKVFALCLFGLLIQLFLDPKIGVFYFAVCGLGFLSYVESALIMLLIRDWQCDIRSVYDVLKSNGKNTTKELP